MNNQNTIEKMKQMRLKGMAEAHYNNLQSANYHDHTIDQYLALLIDQEWEFRQERKINTLKYIMTKNNFSDLYPASYNKIVELMHCYNSYVNRFKKMLYGQRNGNFLY